MAKKVVRVDGNFTSVVFVNSRAKAVVGVSKRMPEDAPSKVVGENLAIVRAFRMLRRVGWK